MQRILGAILAGTLLALSLPGHAAEGVRTIASDHDVATTVDRLVAALEQKSMHIFARVDHAAGAADAGLELAPTQLVIFGNPKVGTKLMQCDRSAAIDLPMKMLVWENDDGVRVGYNTPEYLAERHGLSGCEGVLEKIGKALAGFAEQAAH